MTDGLGDSAPQTLLFFGPKDALSQTVTGRFTKVGFVVWHVTRDDADFLDVAELERLLQDETPTVVMVYPTPQGQGSFLESTSEDWEAALQTIEAVTYLLQTSAKRLEKLGRGRILVLSHVAALTPFRGLSVLGTVLTAITALVKMLALELAPQGITVNAVATGPGLEGLSQPAQSRLTADTPLGADTYASLAKLCLFLASDAAQHITGQTLPVDGGFLLTRASGSSPYV